MPCRINAHKDSTVWYIRWHVTMKEECFQIDLEDVKGLTRTNIRRGITNKEDFLSLAFVRGIKGTTRWLSGPEYNAHSGMQRRKFSCMPLIKVSKNFIDGSSHKVHKVIGFANGLFPSYSLLFRPHVGDWQVLHPLALRNYQCTSRTLPPGKQRHSSYTLLCFLILQML